MATAPANKPAAAAAPEKKEKVKKDPKPLLQRLDEQITRAVISKKITLEEMGALEAKVTKLKALLEA